MTTLHKRSMRQVGLHALYIAVVAGVISLFNPFGISGWSEQRSKFMWQIVRAPFYLPDTVPPTDPRNQIGVVLIDDDARDSIAQRRGIGAFDLIQVIEDVTQSPDAAPRALFIDLLLGDGAPAGVDVDVAGLDPTARAAVDNGCMSGVEREGVSGFRCMVLSIAKLTRQSEWPQRGHCQDGPLEKLRCIQVAGGTPVVIAIPPRSAPSAMAGYRALGKVAIGVDVTIDPERGYRLVSAGAVDPKLQPLSAAAILYAAHCPSPNSPGGCNAPSVVRANGDWDPAYKRPLDVVWGEGRRSEFSDMVDQKTVAAYKSEQSPCFDQDRLQAMTFKRLLATVLYGMNIQGWFGAEAAQPCLYTDTLPYGLYQHLDAPDMKLALGNRTLLLGARLADFNDRVDAPPYGALPGVYYHAMALDNLLRYGPKYSKTAREVWPEKIKMTWTDVANSIAEFFVAFCFGLLIIGHRGSGEDAQPVWRFHPWLVIPGSIIVFLLLVFGLARWTNLVPENFNFVALTVIFIIGWCEIAGEWIKPGWTRLKVWLVSAVVNNP